MTDFRLDPIVPDPNAVYQWEQALDIMWSYKQLGYDDPRKQDVFFSATLTVEAELHCWNGQHPVEPNTTIRKVPAGTRVIVPMASRFGDVGIRDTHIDQPRHGYTCRLDPSLLKDWKLVGLAR